MLSFAPRTPPNSDPKRGLCGGKEGGRGIASGQELLDRGGGGAAASGETRAERPYLPVCFLTCQIGVHVPAWQVW